MTEREAPCVEGTLHTRDGKGVVRLKGRYVTNIEDLWSAITEPERLARWFGDVEGDLRVGGEFRATVSRSGWDGRGRVDVCLPPKRLEVTMWERRRRKTCRIGGIDRDGERDESRARTAGRSSGPALGLWIWMA